MTNPVTRYFEKQGIKLPTHFTGEDTSTVEKAAEVLGVKPGQIAKSLAMQQGDSVAIVVAMGTARLDNQKYRAVFDCKATMVKADEMQAKTGFVVGAVSPFGLPDNVAVYLDESLKEFDTVYPAAGTTDSAVQVDVDKLEQYTGGSWVNVCK